MRGRYFQTTAVMSKLTFPATILTAFLCGWLCFFLSSQTNNADTFSLISFLPSGLLQFLGFAVHFLTAVLLIKINSTFGIIHERASIQACAYLLLISIYPPIQVIQASTISGLTFAISIYLLLHTYQRQSPQGYAFHAFAFLGISSLAFPFVVLFAPIFWLSMFNFNALSPRSFTASILGFLLPYWFVLGHAFFYSTLDGFLQAITEMATLTPVDFSLFTASQIAILGYLLILFLTAAAHQLTHSHKDNIRARIYLHFFILLSAVTFILVFLQPVKCDQYIPFLCIEISVLLGHFFAKTHSKVSNMFFILTIIGMFILLGFNLWML